MQRLGSGADFVRGLLKMLAVDLNEPSITKLDFEKTSKDFDEGRISILDRDKGHVVAKISDNDLADAPSSELIRKRLKAHIVAAVRNYYGKSE